MWQNFEIQDYLMEAEKFEVSNKEEILKVSFEKDKEKEEEFIKLVQSEYPYMIIEKEECLIIRKQKKNEQLKENINKFTKLIYELIEEDLIEEITEEFKNIKQISEEEIEKLFWNYLPEKLEDWQIEFAKIVNSYLKEKNKNNKKIETIINEIINDANSNEQYIKLIYELIEEDLMEDIIKEYQINNNKEVFRNIFWESIKEEEKNKKEEMIKIINSYMKEKNINNNKIQKIIETTFKYSI